MRNATVVIAIPFGGRYVPPEWAMSLATLSIPMNTNYSYLTVKGMVRDEARNYLAQRSLEAGSRYTLFIDDDTAPPAFAVHELMYALDQSDDDVAFAAGIYCTKTYPAVPIVSQEIGDGPFWKWKTGEVFEAPFLGTGCMMIKTEVFRKLEKPWFKDINTIDEAVQFKLTEPIVNTPQNVTNKFHMTDDIFFCRKLREAGYKGLAHGGVLPIHFDEFGNAYPLPEDSYPVKHGSISPTAGFGFSWGKPQVKPEHAAPASNSAQ